MLQRLTSLFFRSADDPPAVLVARAHEEDEEEWQLINITEAEVPSGSSSLADVAMNQPSLPVCLPQSSQSAEESAVSLMNNTSLAEEEVPVPLSATGRRLVRGLASQAGALAKVTQINRVQQAQARARRCYFGRNCIQRQNSTRQRLPRQASRQHPKMLNQPGHRNFCH
ncbi:tumor protein p53-inducible nuclear protein 2 [Clupea harengus]|uniref:Tumor protein p53-inducible nuclear protein 2 n=1 Tax=Clupea harengus TaxID=7950 RepID=A0A8M1KIK0_CLUHA|nr:tumor protein p53-inducible nuclear protein 2 [Clupea harengus]XP_042563703.1 tumor protein p53-inducible nuclear protein 2 [Clupea harengus]